MSVTQRMREALYSQNTDELLLYLLTIEHPSQPTRRYVRGHSAVQSRGQVFQPAAFNIDLPRDSDDSPPRVTLAVDAIDRDIIAYIRQVAGPPKVTLEFVLAETPDFVEIGPLEFEARSAPWQAERLQAELAHEPILDEPIPAGTFTPNDFPGLFS